MTCTATAYLGHDIAPPGGASCRCCLIGCVGNHECTCGARWHLDPFGDPTADRPPPAGSPHGRSRDPLDHDPLLDDRPFGDMRDDEF